MILNTLAQYSKTLLVIVGPTAVGKTSAAIKLAQYFRTEIVSADSRQIFKELTIGTAKPSADDLAVVPHHFINSHSINEDYDAAQYGRDATRLLNELFKIHDIVLLCGGSGFYVKAVCEGFDNIPDIPQDLRKDLADRYEREGLAWLQDKMKELDPDYFQVIDSKNPHRLIRALEVKLTTGVSIATFHSKRMVNNPFHIVKVGLQIPMEDLYRRIDARMDQMIEQGLFKEAEHLYEQRERQALQTVGYREIFGFMEGAYDKDEAIRLLKRNTRRYAKRQMTWFKRDDNIHWFSPNDIDQIMDFLSKSLPRV